ncbi:MAG: hypothetical protein ACK56I_15790, partial [bacterium]
MHPRQRLGRGDRCRLRGPARAPSRGPVVHDGLVPGIPHRFQGGRGVNEFVVDFLPTDLRRRGAALGARRRSMLL